MSELEAVLRGAPSGLLETTSAALAARPREAIPWLEGLRAEGAARFATQGFPTPKDEAYRFTPLRSVLRVPHRQGDAERGFRIAGAPRGLEVRRFSEVLAEDPGGLERHLGQVARGGDGFVAQNTALFRDGLSVVTESGKRVDPVHLELRQAASDGPALALPRLLVVVRAGSELTLVESHEAPPAGPHFENGVTEIVLEEGARLEHVRLFRGAAGRASVAHVAVRQARGSRYSSRVFTLGGALGRLHLDVVLGGEGAECVADGLYLAGSGDLVDHHTRIEHARPHATSRQRYKGILDGNSVAIFDGTIVVCPGASGTEAHQENRNLLLSGEAVAHSKPHLAIDTDDVKCSHGATVGRLDPAQLFYLRSRGLDPAVARAVLTYAFAREMVERIADEAARGILETALAGALPGGDSAREVA